MAVRRAAIFEETPSMFSHVSRTGGFAMSRVHRLFPLFAGFLALALVISSASAQAPESPAVSACTAGAGYAPGCDVDQDNDIDITDIQLTAGRWNSTGVYSSGHNHFGETWSGTTPATGLYVQHTATSGLNSALFGQTASTSGYGVRARASATSGTNYGVFADHFSDNGAAVFGGAYSPNGGNYGVYGLSVAGTGVYGRTNAINGFAIHGLANSVSNGQNIGVAGYANGWEGVGVYGQSNSNANSGLTVGVWGWVDAQNGNGVRGVNPNAGGRAGYFVGHVEVLGNLHKLGGSFKIDHPLDPANKYLYHSFVESPDMMNIYNGNVLLDEKGEAWVELAGWFEALNQDFRYQLTPIGGWAPLYVAEKIQGNRFKIAGGEPGLEVSWQVTGIRHDVWAEQNRIPVEEDKPADEQGLYLYPKGYGRPDTEMVDYLPPPSQVQASQP
jgi:hypothetical protein